MYHVIWVVAFLATGKVKRHPHSSQSKHETITDAVTIPDQRQRRRAIIETVLGKWHVFAGVLPLSMQQTRVGVVLGQRRRTFVGIKPAMGCNTGPTLNRN